jgi:hypothetical protein
LQICCIDWAVANICSTTYGEKMTGMAGCKKYVQVCVAARETPRKKPVLQAGHCSHA